MQLHLFNLEYGISTFVVVALMLLKLFALVDAVTRRAPAFLAADKLTKPGWLWILGLSLVAQIVFPSPINILSLIGTVAAIVYIVDVRPAVAALTRR